MKTKKEIIGFLSNFDGVYLDYPFDVEWAALRHTANKKTYAFIFERNDFVYVNLKLEPTFSHMIRQAYDSVIPAYHMNKEHWVSVICDGSVPENELLSLAALSYDLTSPKPKKDKR